MVGTAMTVGGGRETTTMHQIIIKMVPFNPHDIYIYT